MFQINRVKVILVELLMLLTLYPSQHETLIITSVIAGNKKFKTVSFDHKWLKPLTFEKDLPFPTEFRRHRTLRPPKFDIDVNIPIKLPVEDEYPQEEYKKPVESNLFFQTDEIHEPGYGKKKSNYNSNNGHKQANTYKDAEYAASSDVNKQVVEAKTPSIMEQGFKLLPMLAKSIKFQPNIVSSQERQSNARTDTRDLGPQQEFSQPQRRQQTQQLQVLVAQESAYGGGQYAQPKGYQKDNYQQDFVPGGFVNLQLSGPTGGPKMTHEDYDRERWAQQLSQTEAAMPYPILNYHQLQNFYGGLGTFTNGLAEQRYVEHSLLDKLKSGLTHFTDKLHFG